MISDPTISVVVPTYNRRERLARVVDALMRQQLDAPFEIVVVDDGSSDGTMDYLTSLQVPVEAEVDVRHTRQDNLGPAAARNRGVRMATGELIVFIDDDVAPSAGMLQAHVDAHRRLGEGFVVIGPMLDPADHEMSAWVRWEQAMLQKQYSAMDAGEYAATARQFYTGNASVRREHLAAVGGFNETFRRAEDVELAYRLDDHGLEFFYESSAIGYHYAERTFDAWRSSAFAYGRNDVIFARDHDREWMMTYMGFKFRSHHPAIRVVTVACIRWSWLRRPVSTLLGLVLSACDRIRFDSPVRYALSGIYSVEYHSGVATELGTNREFFDVIRA